MEHQLIQKPKISEFVKDLSTNLTALQPNRSEIGDSAKQTTQLITYALIATAVVGIMVYQYIKESEREEELKNYHG